MGRSTTDIIPIDELLKAYRLGYFPMARERNSDSVVWVRPDIRGAVVLDKFRITKKLRRLIARDPFEVTVDKAFASVMKECAAATPTREDTWINDQIYETYCELFRQDIAHSVECWLEGELVGGLYGISIGGAFFGESMFSRKDHASKVAMAYLAARLKLAGYTLLDAQFYTEHLAQFGITEISSEKYLELLKGALKIKADFYSVPELLSSGTVLQSITQTS